MLIGIGSIFNNLVLDSVAILLDSELLNDLLLGVFVYFVEDE